MKKRGKICIKLYITLRYLNYKTIVYICVYVNVTEDIDASIYIYNSIKLQRIIYKK